MKCKTNKIIASFADTNLDSHIEMCYISFPKKNGSGYIKYPVGRSINERTRLIEEMGLSIDNEGYYWLSVHDANHKHNILDLLNQLSKIYKTSYEFFEWDRFWEFIDSLPEQGNG